MALAFGTPILDGRRTKVFTITCLDNDAAANLDILYTGNGMTALQSGNAIAYGWVIAASAADVAVDFAITTASNTNLIIRKLTAGGGANAKTVRIWVTIPRGIAS